MTINLYTASEVAKILRVKKAYVYELIATGRLKTVKLSERRLRISEDALLDLGRDKKGKRTYYREVFNGKITQARLRAAELEAELKKRTGPAKTMTVGQYLETWLDRIKGTVAERTHRRIPGMSGGSGRYWTSCPCTT